MIRMQEGGGAAVRRVTILFTLCAVLMVSHVAVAQKATTTSWYDGHVSGQSRSVYEYESMGDESDSDFYEYLSFSDRDLFRRRLDLYASGRLHWDFDDSATSQADDFYAGIEDVGTTDEQYLYQCYLEAHDAAKQYRLRAGRQYVDIAEGMQIDGAQFAARESGKIGGRVFLGQPVSYYSSISNDWAAGCSVVGRPWLRNETRLTYVRYHDDTEDDTDERWNLESRQRWLDVFKARVQASELNNHFEMAGLNVSYMPTESDFDGSLGLYRWGGVNGDTLAYSPLAEVLGERAPYTYVDARLSKGILSWLYITPEVAARFVAAEDEDEQNRDYTRYSVSLGADPNEACSASVAGEYWSVEEGDSFFGMSGEIRYRYQKLWEAATGVGYFDYEYVQYTDFAGTVSAGDVRYASDGTRIESSPTSRSYFVRGKYNINRSVSVQVRADLEDDSEEQDRSFRGQTSLVIRI